jgi:dihydroflavonol-4-reductase
METVVRRHQAEGAPVVILYPPATVGPADPHLGDQILRVRNLLKGLIPIWPSGGIALADVRDVADLITAAADEQFTAKRAAPKATFVMTKDYVQTMRKVTGRRLPVVYVPWQVLMPLAWALQYVQKAVPFHIPAEYGAIYACSCQPRFDDSAIVVPNDSVPHTLEQTFTDSVRWLYEQGQLTRTQAGRALTAPPSPAVTH